jgi:outer membrane lipoprotein-sorting protein
MSRYPKLTVLLVGMLAATASRAAQPGAVDLLRKSYAADSQGHFTGRLRTTLYLGSGSTSAEVEVFRSGRRSRMEYCSGRSAGVVIIDDGDSIIRLDSSGKTAYISATAEAPEDLDLLLANYRPVAAGTDKVAGRTCYVLRLEPTYSGNPWKKLWIDTAVKVALKHERYGSDGRVTTRTEYASVDFGARPSSSLFTVPHGWKSVRLGGGSSDVGLDSVRRQVGFTTSKPGYVPRGYLFDGYYVRETPGRVRFAGLRYTNGLNTISIFERKGDCPSRGFRRGAGGGRHGRGPGGGRRGAGDCVMAAENPHARMLRVTTGELTVILVGDIAETELRKMADSLR